MEDGQSRILESCCKELENTRSAVTDLSDLYLINMAQYQEALLLGLAALVDDNEPVAAALTRPNGDKTRTLLLGLHCHC